MGLGIFTSLHVDYNLLTLNTLHLWTLQRINRLNSLLPSPECLGVFTTTFTGLDRIDNQSILHMGVMHTRGI